MNMKQCKNGHFYDAEKNAECPYCSSGRTGIVRPLGEEPEIAKTAPIKDIEVPAFPKTVPLTPPTRNGGSTIPPTVPLDGAQLSPTVPLQVNEKGIDPVRGWLVCIEGGKKGRDFRLHSEKNFIGRTRSNDVCLDFDESISRDTCAIISYDVKKNRFWLQPGEGKSNIYVNEDILLLPKELSSYDKIQIGRTVLIFVPFCSDKFTW